GAGADWTGVSPASGKGESSTGWCRAASVKAAPRRSASRGPAIRRAAVRWKTGSPRSIRCRNQILSWAGESGGEHEEGSTAMGTALQSRSRHELEDMGRRAWQERGRVAPGPGLMGIPVVGGERMAALPAGHVEDSGGFVSGGDHHAQRGAVVGVL